MDPDGETKVTAFVKVPLIFSLSFLITCKAYRSVKIETKEVGTSITAEPQNVPDSLLRNLYFTFDDGPNKGTDSVMQVVQSTDIPASFFLIGIQLKGSTKQTTTWQKLKEEPLIEIQNHSYTHAGNRFDRFYNQPEQVVQDFERCKDSLGIYSTIARTPGRNIWRTSAINATDIASSKRAADAIVASGFSLLGWDLEWNFNNNLKLTKSPIEMIFKIDSFFKHGLTKTPGHLVILAHDQAFADSTDAAALRFLIQKLKSDNRYRFKKISAYPGLK